jgi:hypothetical protein
MICPDCHSRLENADGGNVSALGVRAYYKYCPTCDRRCRVKIKRGIENFEGWVDESIVPLTWPIIKRTAIDDLIWFREIQPETQALIERMRTNG